MNNLFKKNGFVKLKNVISSEDINKINSIIYDFFHLENILRQLESRLDINKDKYYINNEYNLVNSIEKMIHYPKPIIYNRVSKNRLVDKGVIDIFKPITLLPELKRYINMELIESLVSKLCDDVYKIFGAKIIIQRCVANPMKFSKKNYKKDSINCNIFLSDINDIIKGPYVMIKNSNKSGYNVNENDLEIIYGNKGDVIIYDTNLLRKRLKQYNKNDVNIYLSLILVLK